jgi:NAD-dependent dihydropyrimidine dehydrogenase PreA subunit
MKLEMKVGYEPGDPGQFITVDERKCTGCGECARFCAREVWRADGAIFRPAGLARCAECGACWNICPADAVRLGEPRGGTGVRFSHG